MARKYTLTDRESGISCEITSTDMRTARGRAVAWARGAYESGESTYWIDVEIKGRREHGTCTIAVHPREPKCTRKTGHVWGAPHELVGGLRENPGVWGHVGGVRIQEVCMRCGCGRMTDTWAQRPDTGVQGLTSVAYEPGKYTELLRRAA